MNQQTKPMKERSVGSRVTCSSCERRVRVSERMKRTQSRKCDACFQEDHTATLADKTMSFTLPEDWRDMIRKAKSDHGLNISEETRNLWRQRLRSLGYDVSGLSEPNAAHRPAS